MQSNCFSIIYYQQNGFLRSIAEEFGSSTVCDRTPQKKPKNRKTELKKTGIAPIVKCPTKTVGGIPRGRGQKQR